MKHLAPPARDAEGPAGTVATQPPADPIDAADHRLGSILVVLQLSMMALLAVASAPSFVTGRAPRMAWALLGLAMTLGASALRANRPGNFNVHPAPRTGGRLVERGPYRWIRHPMYTSVACGAAAAAWAAPSAWTWAAAVTLGAVLGAKAALEEHWMARKHPGYAAYRARTRAFVPWVW